MTIAQLAQTLTLQRARPRRTRRSLERSMWQEVGIGLGLAVLAFLLLALAERAAGTGAPPADRWADPALPLHGRLDMSPDVSGPWLRMLPVP